MKSYLRHICLFVLLIAGAHAWATDCTYYVWDAVASDWAVYTVQDQEVVVPEGPDTYESCSCSFVGWHINNPDNSSWPTTGSGYISYQSGTTYYVRHMPNAGSSTDVEHTGKGATALYAIYTSNWTNDWTKTSGYTADETAQVTITFNNNGGSGTMPTQKILKNNATHIRLHNFTAPSGKFFAGWATSPSGDAVYPDGGIISISSNTTLYAVWLSDTKASVIYELEGLEHDGSYPKTLNDGDYLETDFTISSGYAAPVTGYVKVGDWYTYTLGVDAEVEYSAGTLTCVGTIAGGDIVVVHLSATESACTPYDIYISNTGTGSTDVDPTACAGETVTFTATPGTGYAYGGAYILFNDFTDLDLAASAPKSFTMKAQDVSIDVTFTAKTYTVTLNPNGGSGSNQTVSALYDAAMPLTLSGSSTPIVIPTRTGYEFGGFRTGTSGGTMYYNYGGSPAELSSARTWNIASNTTLYAKWTAKQTLITLHKNGGANDGAATVTFDATSLSDVDHATGASGYQLEGYYTNDGTPVKVLNADGTFATTNVAGYITSGKWSNESAEITLYAHWTLNTHSIHWYKNAEDADALTGSYTDGNAVAFGTTIVAPNTPTRTGYTFAGWAETSSGAVVSPVTTMPDADKTYYAQWTPNSHTLAVASVSHVTISATTPSIAAGGNASVNYGTMVTLNYTGVATGYSWAGWRVYKTGDASTTVTVNGSNQFTMPDYDVTVSAYLFGDLRAWCADFEMTGPTGDLVFITSTAGQTVRSQEAFHLTGSDLTPNQTLTFSFGSDALNARFAFKTATGGAITTDGSGAIDTDIYVFYTPDAGDTDDGWHEATILSANVGGAQAASATVTTKTILGRHLPANFVIAAKREGKWYALPADMTTTTGTPSPVEIAVDDTDNPSMAFTTDAHVYSLYGQTNTVIAGGNGEYIKLAMHGQSNAPLFGSSSDAKIGKSGTANVTSDLSEPRWWKLVQTAAAPANVSEATYTVYCANNSSNHLRLKENSGNPKWGLYADGIDELRLVPYTATLTEAEIVEWGRHGVIVEVDANAISANQVVARLNGVATEAITLTQTRTSVKSSATKYNYTLAFGDGIDLAATASNGATLSLEWRNNTTTVGGSNITVPRIIAESRNMYKSGETGKTAWATDVVVLPGVTLTANANSFSGNNVTVNHLEIYPGATVSVTTGTLIATTLVLRNGWARAEGQRFDVARLHIADGKAFRHTNAYADWYIDYDQYYPIAVPWPVTTSGMSYKNSNSTASAGVTMRYYNGAARAAGSNNAQLGENWIACNNGVAPAYPATLNPGEGYAITAKRPTGKAFSIIRMPLSFTDDWTDSGERGDYSSTHKDQVAVTAHGDAGTPWYNKGWNFIGNPYMALYQGALSGDDAEIAYATIPDIQFKEFDQLPFASTKLKPSSGFFVQVGQTGTVTFGTANRKAAAPARTHEQETPVQKAYIQLANEQHADLMGLLIGEQYTAEYELNADLVKILGESSSLRTYMDYNGTNMAYLALNALLAQEWIPVIVRIPAAGEYTFSLEDFSTLDHTEGIYLTDYQTHQTTNLLYDTYTFVTAAGTIAGRFALNAAIGERQTPTNVDVVGSGTDGPIKFMYHGNMYILRNGIIYDATGKRVSERRDVQ